MFTNIYIYICLKWVVALAIATTDSVCCLLSCIQFVTNAEVLSKLETDELRYIIIIISAATTAEHRPPLRHILHCKPVLGFAKMGNSHNPINTSPER